MKKIMIQLKKFYFIIFVLNNFIFNVINGQKNSPQIIDTTNFSWTPIKKHKVINGLAIGLSATWEDTILVKVNGVNLEVSPYGIIGGIWGTMFGLGGFTDDNGIKSSFFSENGYDTIYSRFPKYYPILNGLSISIFGAILSSNNRGFFINGLSNICSEIKGVQITGLININYKLNGVSIAGISNVATNGNGIQIGLINKCKTGNVVQIGLFNRIGKRVIPFINFRYSNKKENK